MKPLHRQAIGDMFALTPVLGGTRTEGSLENGGVDDVVEGAKCGEQVGGGPGGTMLTLDFWISTLT
jgi:hypothetical protein